MRNSQNLCFTVIARKASYLTTFLQAPTGTREKFLEKSMNAYQGKFLVKQITGCSLGNPRISLEIPYSIRVPPPFKIKLEVLRIILHIPWIPLEKTRKNYLKNPAEILHYKSPQDFFRFPYDIHRFRSINFRFLIDLSRNSLIPLKSHLEFSKFSPRNLQDSRLKIVQWY